MRKPRNQTGYFKKQYYSDVIYRSQHLAKLREKVECEKCKNMVNKSSLLRHQKRDICKKRYRARVLIQVNNQIKDTVTLCN
jgi:formylmethanofuran dehydrogenase subunit E